MTPYELFKEALQDTPFTLRETILWLVFALQWFVTIPAIFWVLS